MVRVVGELRQLAARRQRRRGDERRWADLLESVGVAVEGVLAQRPGERRAEATLQVEHRAADLHRPFGVEDAERGAGLPVRHALVQGKLVRHPDRPVDHRVVGVTRAVGRIRMRHIGNPEQHLPQRGLRQTVLRGEILLVRSELSAARLQAPAPSTSPAPAAHRPPSKSR
ncbi:MAG: hypothetical protein WKF58_07250 [Ilumatobacteraceae bacterium]